MAPARSGLRPSYRETATRHLFTALRQAQTPADRDRLIERLVTVNLPLCDGLAGRYANRGAEIDDPLWHTIFGFSERTFLRHGNAHYLSAAFLSEVARRMPESLIVSMQTASYPSRSASRPASRIENSASVKSCWLV